ncbi:Sphingomyelin phosphodiesterase 2 [Grifola frondosa]|uniref:Sphingomyelin phosphodiesterase 2 n=1 Tax=Grifola frondosa TaxID=5627 RepID=A0A1C7LVC4_GRIFR|nr:Sphingomyelin phosphodiesterase 2 [Grifola frondosa]
MRSVLATIGDVDGPRVEQAVVHVSKFTRRTFDNEANLERNRSALRRLSTECLRAIHAGPSLQRHHGVVQHPQCCRRSGLRGAVIAGTVSNDLGPSAFTAPGAFPTSVYRQYYNSPTATSAQPQPHKTYPFSLTDPANIPKGAIQNDTNEPHPLPPKASSSLLLEQAFAQVLSIATNPVFGTDSCTRCQAALEVGKFLAMAAPEQGPALAVQLCEHFSFNKDCATQYSVDTIGAVVTQVIANADVGGFDGQPKPNPLPAPKTPSGKRLKVLHLSDMHIDPRYANGAEANCTSGLCCRENNFNTQSPNHTLFPAPRYGSYLCDSPRVFDFTVYTGDLVSHDSENQLSREYVSYTETVMYDLLKRMLGAGPVYAALGNHDTYNQNYDHVAALWQHEEWLPQAAIELARAHYAAYMVKRQDGLRVITLNTDMWYTANYFNYINLSHPDTSGMLRFLTDELQDAEDAGDRVWILGHVLSGWDGTNPLKNPTDLFYQIVDRFTPHVITGIFFGHTHEDQVMIYYANNATNISAQAAGGVGWIGPSLTPLTNLNSGFRVYEVDSGTFEVVDAYTWKSDVNSFPTLDSQTALGPTYEFEYSTREAYGTSITEWGANDPLNATWWHLVTEGTCDILVSGVLGAHTSPVCHCSYGSGPIACHEIQYLPRQGFRAHDSVHRQLHRSEDMLHAQRKRQYCDAELHPWLWFRSVAGEDDGASERLKADAMCSV